jgi:hypothetical protein
MSNQRFTAEFKEEAVRQIVERGYSVAEVRPTAVLRTHPRKQPIGAAIDPSESLATGSYPISNLWIVVRSGRFVRWSV